MSYIFSLSSNVSWRVSCSASVRCSDRFNFHFSGSLIWNLSFSDIVRYSASWIVICIFSSGSIWSCGFS